MKMHGKLIFLLLFAYTSAFSQVNQLLTTENGLSNNSITYIYKDSRGYIWIGTTDGLNRYDGNSFTVFKHQFSNTNSISDNFISSIIEDYEGNLWIGTQGNGLNRFNPFTEEFTAFYHNPADPESIPSNFIFHHNSLILDNDSVLWIGTDKGLCKYNFDNNKFKRIRLGVKNEEEFKDIRVIFLDSDKNYWIGTNSGLIKYTNDENVVEIFKSDASFPLSLTNNIITCIIENEALDELWIGTEYGLNVYESKNNRFRTYLNEKGKTGTISDNSITSLAKDDKGNIWAGTKSGGVNKYIPEEDAFIHFKRDLSGTNNISDNYIEYVFYDSKGLLWLGTVNAGINVIDINEKKFTLIRNNPANPNSLSYNTIRSVYEDKEGIVWIGTYGGGLNRFDGSNFRHFVHRSNNPEGLSHNIVSSFCEDNNGKLWIGTWGGGVNIMNTKSLQIKKGPEEVNEFINDIHKDSKGIIWIGSNSGLFIYDPVNNRLIDNDINTKLKKLVKGKKEKRFWTNPFLTLQKLNLPEKTMLLPLNLQQLLLSRKVKLNMPISLKISILNGSKLLPRSGLPLILTLDRAIILSR